MDGPQNDEFNQEIQDIQNTNLNIKIEGDLQSLLGIRIGIGQDE